MPRRIDEDMQRRVIELYTDDPQELSIRKVAGLLGISYQSARNILIRNNVKRRSVGGHEKYLKTDFSGDLSEQARILGFTEDCAAKRVYRQLELRTSSTHPSQIELFYDIFRLYGHVGRTTNYNSRHSLYQWQTWVYLNPTFYFVIEYKNDRVRFLSEITKSTHFYDYVAGLTDSEGHVGIHDINGHPTIILSIGNKYRPLLEWTRGIVGGAIYANENCYQLVLRDEEATEALQRLPICHEEKVAAKELILYYANNRGHWNRSIKSLSGT